MFSFKKSKNTVEMFLCFIVISLVCLLFLIHPQKSFSRCGDVDGDGNIYSNDVLMVARASINILTLTADQKLRTDVVVSASDTPDGNIYSNDLLIIARASLGMVEPLCSETTATGKIEGYVADEESSDKTGITVVVESVDSTTGLTRTTQAVIDEVGAQNSAGLGRNSVGLGLRTQPSSAAYGDAALQEIGQSAGYGNPALQGIGRHSLDRILQKTTKTATTDATGFFSVTGLPPGKYVACAIKVVGIQNPTCAKAADPVTYPEYAGKDAKVGIIPNIEIKTPAETVSIGRKDDPNPQFKIARAGSIRGKITLKNTSTHLGILVFVAGTSFMAMTDTSGGYTIYNVPVGQYILVASKSGYSEGMKAGITVGSGQIAVAPEFELQPITSCSLSISSITASPQTVYTGASSTITVTAQSSDCNPLSYTYTPTGGTIAGSGSQVKWQAPAAAGIYSIYVGVSDGTKNTNSSISLFVKEKAILPPEINSLTANPQLVPSGETSTFTGVIVYTGASENLSYNWYITAGIINPLTATASGTSAIWTAKNEDGTLLADGIYTIYLEVSDSINPAVYGGLSVLVTKPALQPLTPSITASKTYVNTSETITLTATSTNLNNGTLSYTWSVDGGTLSSTSGTTPTWTAPTTAGIYNISLTASDGKGGSGKTMISISVSVPILPLNPSITASKTTVDAGETITLSAASTNPNGGTLFYSWSADGGTVPSSSGASSTWTAPAASGVYNILLTVSDGKGGSGKTAISISVKPPAPEIANVQYSGRAITAYDSSNTKLWDYIANSNITAALVSDVDGNGSNDVVFATDRDGSDKGVIYVLNKTGSKLWSYKTGGTGVYWTDEQLAVNQILVDDVDGDGKKEVVSSSYHYTYYPARICIISDTGQLQGSYWNPGRMVWLVLDDIDNDGRKEIIAGGGNNDNAAKASVFALDGESIVGELEAPPDSGSGTGGSDKQKWYTYLPVSGWDKYVTAISVVTESGVKKIKAENSAAGYIYYLDVNGNILNPPVNAKPSASITANPTSGVAPLTVYFAGSCTDTDGTCISYSWNFGDNTSTSSFQNASHTYSFSGVYTVVLTVADNGGTTASSSLIINVTPPPQSSTDTLTFEQGMESWTATNIGTAGSGITIEQKYAGTYSFKAGPSQCGASCFDSHGVILKKTFSTPVYIETLSYYVLEESNWGGVVDVIVNRTRDDLIYYNEVTGRSDVFTVIENNAPITHQWVKRDVSIKQVVSKIEIIIHDITSQTNMYLDDIKITVSAEFFNHSRWTKYASNPILSSGGNTSPSVIYDGSVYKIWYNPYKNGSFQTISYATSTNGVAWSTPQSIVINTSRYLGSPMVIKDEATYKMWYVGINDPSVYYAESSDGLNWTDAGAVLIEPPSIAFPYVMKEGLTYKMWYAVDISNPGSKVYYTESQDGRNWTKKGSVLDVGTYGSFDAYGLNMNGRAVVVKNLATGNYMMWYGGHTTLTTGRIGYAESTDGLNWTKYGMEIDISSNENNIGPSAILSYGVALQMWYRCSTTYANYANICYADTASGTGIVR